MFPLDQPLMEIVKKNSAHYTMSSLSVNRCKFVEFLGKNNYTVIKNNYTVINCINTNKKILTELAEHKKKSMTYDTGNPGPGLGQAQKCGRIKPVTGIP